MLHSRRSSHRKCGHRTRQPSTAFTTSSLHLVHRMLLLYNHIAAFCRVCDIFCDPLTCIYRIIDSGTGFLYNAHNSTLECILQRPSRHSLHLGTRSLVQCQYADSCFSEIIYNMNDRRSSIRDMFSRSFSSRNQSPNNVSPALLQRPVRQLLLHSMLEASERNVIRSRLILHF